MKFPITRRPLRRRRGKPPRRGLYPAKSLLLGRSCNQILQRKLVLMKRMSTQIVNKFSNIDLIQANGAYAAVLRPKMKTGLMLCSYEASWVNQHRKQTLQHSDFNGDAALGRNAQARAAFPVSQELSATMSRRPWAGEPVSLCFGTPG